MNLRRLIFERLLFIPLVAFSCAEKKDQNFDSFEKFAGNLVMQPTDLCDRDCINLKKEFRYVVYTGEKIYCYWNEKQEKYKIDFKQLANQFEEQITSKTSQKEYFNLLVKWAGVFHDGHVNAMMRADYSELKFFSIDVRFEVLAPGTDHEKLIISRAGSALTNLRVGTVVSRIQGKDWKDYMNDAEKFTSGSTLQMRRRQAGNSIPAVLFETEGIKPIKVEGQYNGKDVSEIVPRVLALYDGSKDPDDSSATGIDSIKSSVLENNIGYLRIDEFGGTQMAKLLSQAMDALSDTSGLIIDLRKNGGGDNSGNAVLARLINSTIFRYHQRVRNSEMLNALRPYNLIDYDFSEGEFSEMKERKIAPAEEKLRYKNPVLVLTSAYCFSACDTFVSSFKENKLGQIMGEPTGGGTGQPQHIELPYSDHSFRYSVAQGYTAVGKKQIEGEGTQPDILLEPTVEERALGKDLQLVKAVQYFANNFDKTGTNSKVIALPENLLNVKTEQIKKPFEIERDREIRKSKD